MSDDAKNQDLDSDSKSEALITEEELLSAAGGIEDGVEQIGEEEEEGEGSKSGSKGEKKKSKKERKREEKEKKREEKAKEDAQVKVVKFNKKIEIYCDKPLEKYTTGEILAYAAKDMSGEGKALYVLICRPHILPRTRDASTYMRISSPYLSGLVDMGVRYWPLEGAERLMLVYQDNVGSCLVDVDQEVALGWSQDKVLEEAVKPIIMALQEMHNRDFVHGGIRLSNLYQGNFDDADADNLVLGDALSGPCSYSQPALYLSVERGMADPIARGQGSLADDVYAFGVALACMLRNNDPLARKTDREIIFEKIEQGSYAAITGRDRFTGSILELLRGALHDDPTQRWTIEEITEWSGGKRLSPKQALKHIKAARSMEFNNEKYFYKNQLAMDLETNLGECCKVFEDESLEQWIMRSLQEEEVELRFDKFVLGFKEREMGKPNYEERLVSNISMTLHESAPIRYKGLHLMGDGLGPALVEAVVTRRDVQPFVEMFSKNIVTSWLGIQFQSTFDIASLVARCDAVRVYLRQGGMGSGLERAVYTLTSDVHCLSPSLEGYIVYDSEGLIRAFEKVCAEGRAPKRFIDRHCAAFLAERDNKVISSSLYDLASPEPHKHLVADLRCLASIQYRYKMPFFPNIGEAYLDLLPSVLERYHDADVRNTVEKQLKKLALSGNLIKMANVLDNQDVKQKDMRAFKYAMREYRELQAELIDLTSRLQNKDVFTKFAGKEIAAFFSIVLGGITTLIVAILYMSQGPSF